MFKPVRDLLIIGTNLGDKTCLLVSMKGIYSMQLANCFSNAEKLAMQKSNLYSLPMAHSQTDQELLQTEMFLGEATQL